MKRIILFIFCIIALQNVNAQSQIVSELSEAVTDLAGSFMDNPYHHANTQKIYNNSEKFKQLIDDMCRQALYSNHPQARIDLQYLENMKSIVTCINYLSACIVGYSRGGIDGTEIESFNYIMNGFGWTRTTIFESQPDLLFHEYKKGKFRMVLVQNKRPKSSYADHNSTSYRCYTYNPYRKEHYWFTSSSVFGGNYRFVECGDDQTQYTKITKVEAKRGGW